MKYRKKPVVIDAMQYTQDTLHSVMTWIETFVEHNSEVLSYNEEANRFDCITLEGKLEISEGDFLIRGVKGEFYPCKPDIFHLTYDTVEEESTAVLISGYFNEGEKQ